MIPGRYRKGDINLIAQLKALFFIRSPPRVRLGPKTTHHGVLRSPWVQ